LQEPSEEHARSTRYILPPVALPLVRELLGECNRSTLNTSFYFKGKDTRLIRLREYGTSKGSNYVLQQRERSQKDTKRPITLPELDLVLRDLRELPVTRCTRQHWTYPDYRVLLDTDIQFFRPNGLWKRQQEKSLSALLGPPDAVFQKAIVECTPGTPKELHTQLIRHAGQRARANKLTLAQSLLDAWYYV